MNYQFTDSTNTVVFKFDDDGLSRVSFLVDAEGPYQDEYRAWLEAGNVTEPYVPPPPATEPTIDEKLASVGLTIDDLKTALGLN